MTSKTKNGITTNTTSKGTTYTAQVDLKRFHFRAKQTFGTFREAKDWKGDTERRIRAQGENRLLSPKDKTIGELVKDYCDDARARGQRWSPTKQDNLDALVKHIGDMRLSAYNRHKLFDYCAEMRKTRGASGAQERLIYLGAILKFGRQRLTLDVPLDEHAAGMSELRSMGKHGGIANTNKRNVNWRTDQIEAVKAKLEGRDTKLICEIIDILQIIPFRANELVSIKWTDLDPVERTVTLRNVKDKSGPGVDRIVSLTKIGDVDTYELIAGRARTRGDDRVFPIDRKSLSARWSDANGLAGIDVHVHDMRHHAISELFTTHGWEVPAVAHYTGHKDWKVLAANYGKLAPAQMHKYAERQRLVNAYVEKQALGHNGGPRIDG